MSSSVILLKSTVPWKPENGNAALKAKKFPTASDGEVATLPLASVAVMYVVTPVAHWPGAGCWSISAKSMKICPLLPRLARSTEPAGGL